MKRRSQNALSVAMGALLAGSLAIAPVSAAPDGPQTRIYSDTFTPLMRIPDEQALQNCRYCSHPGAAPNWILPAFSDHGHDAFLNSPDLTFGTNALSAVSAEVCLELDGDQDSAFALIYFGVQDKDRNVVFWTDPDTQYPFLEVTTVGSQLCETLTFPSPVKLVNHPHLVVAVELILESGANYAEVDGVTYTLRPSKASDVTPNSTWPYAFALGRFEED